MANASSQWQHIAALALIAAVVIMGLLRIPVVGRFLRLAFSAALLAFLIFVLLQQAPYQPELSRITQKLGFDDQRVSGKELHVDMSPDGHFWVLASINGVPRRMLIDSGATVTAISEQTAHEAHVATGTGLAPVILQTANGAAPAQIGEVREIRIGNIVARNLRIVTGAGLGNLDVLGMNFLSRLRSWRVEGGSLVLVPHHAVSPAKGS